MILSTNGLEKLYAWEGKRKKMYIDDAGHPTISVGHKLSKSELSSGKIKIGGVLVDWREGLTNADVDVLTRQNIARYEKLVNEMVKVPLTQNQFDTLVIFSFNIGPEAFRTSSALRWVNQLEYDRIPEALAMFNKITNKQGVKVVDDGLVNRRNKEIGLWKQ